MSILHRLAPLLFLASANAWATGATLTKVEVNYSANGSTYTWVTVAANQTISIAPNTTFYVRLTRSATGTAPWTYMCGPSSAFPDSAQSSVSGTTSYTFFDRTGTGQWRVAVDTSEWFYFNIQTATPATYSLTVTVSNVDSNPGVPATGNGRVSLFTAAGAAVGSPLATNSSRQVSFSGLAAGNYYYTVEHLAGAFSQIEYWGRRDLSISANTSSPFTRNQPYLSPSGFVDLTNASAPIPTGSTIPLNHQVRGDFSILQPNGTSTVRMLLDNDKLGLLQSDTSCTGTTSANCPSAVLSAPGAYYRGYILTAGGRVVDTGDWGSSVFTVAAPAYSLTVTVNNIASNPGLPTTGNGRVSLFTAAGSAVGSPVTTNASRQVSFSNLPAGNYYYIVEHLASAFGQIEYWGRRDLSINANVSESFIRNQPYVSPSGFVDLTNASAPIPTGSTIPLSHQVRGDFSILQPNGTSTLRMLLDNDKVGSLQSDTTCTGTISASCPSAILSNPGAYYRGYILTSGGRVVDTGDWGASVFTVAAPSLPDITISTLSPSPAAVPKGASMTLNYSLVNNAPTPTTAAFPVQFFLSTAPTPDPAATLLGTQTIASVPASTTLPVTFQVTVPATVAPGIYWLVAKVDPNNVLPESSENNNVFAIRFSVFDSAAVKRGTTVITHGFAFLGSIDQWPFEMAKAICRRAGGGRLLVYKPTLGAFALDQSTAECASTDPASEAVLVYDWARESNNALNGWSESAGDALFALLTMGRNKSAASLEHLDLSNLHFIGHSRGTIVNSEAVERLLYYAPQIGLPITDLHVTTLDPHDAGNTLLPFGFLQGIADDYDVNDIDTSAKTRGVRVWKDETYHDNYWQGIEELRGQSLANGGAHDVDKDTSATPYFAQLLSGCVRSIQLGSACHSLVWQYYMDTITGSDLPEGYSLSRIASAGVSRQDSRFTSAPSELPAAVPLPFDPAHPRTGILNGDLQRSLSGWEHKGGQGNTPNVAGRLILGGSFNSQTHNWFFVPVNAERIYFEYDHDQPTWIFGRGTLTVSLYSEGNARQDINAFVCDSVPVSTIVLSNGTANAVQCAFAIPAAFRGRSARIGFSFDSSVSYVKLGNIRLGLSGDVTPPILSISPPAGGLITSSTSISLSGSASDAFGVSVVNWRNNRGGFGSAVRNGTSWTASSIPLQPGANLLTVTAIDANGNSSSSAITVTRTTIDSIPPSSVSIDGPAAAATVSGLVPLAATATDDSGFIQQVSFFLDNSAAPACSAKGPVPSDSSSSCIWDSASTANGAHSLTAVAYDPAGNQKASLPLSLTVDNALPFPSKPGSPSPANSAVNVSTLPQLAWSASQNASTYDFYFAGNCSGLSKLKTVSQPALDLGAAIGALTPSATFCWKVVAVGPGGSTSSDNWTFTTLPKPDLPTAPTPATGATAVPLNQTLSWTPGANTASTAIAFGTSNPPAGSTPVSGSSYSPGALSAGVTYYWRVLATNNSGTTSGPVWSFTTQAAAPGSPTSPSPSNGAQGVSPNPTLTWAPGPGATSHDVYFGTSSTPPLVQADMASNGYNPGALSGGTTYYWRVVAKNSSGPTTSATWSFTTVVPVSLPGAPTNLSPSNGATNVQTTPTLTWTGGTGATSHDVYFGASSTPPLALVDTTGNSFNPGTLTPGATYYWRAVAKNSVGPTTSPVFSFTVVPPVITNLPPTLVSATPNNPSTSPQTFTITARDPNGFADINRIGFLISSDSTLPANACHGYYDRATNAVYLDDDALSSKTGPLTPGSAAKIENSQCVVSGPASALYQAAGTDLAIKLDIGLKSNFASQSRKIFFLARDNQASETGWIQTGTWAPIAPPVNQPPIVVSGTPNNPIASPQSFTFTARDPNGFADINRLYFLINQDSLIPRNTCHGLYDRPTNSIYLYDDALTTPLGPLTPGANATIQNSQCLINGAASALVQTSGTDLVLKLEIGLKGSFLNKSQNIYLWALDSQNLGTGWVYTGTWTPASAPPPNVPPTIVSGSPNLPVGSPQNFTFLARDLNGVSDIYRLYFLVNPDSSIPQNTCHGLYDRQTNSVYLYNDALTAPIGPLTPGAAGKIENSQCVINGPASALYLNAGNDLGLKLDISLKGSFAAKSHKVYLWAQDLQNSGTGWVQTATWAPASTPVNAAPSVVSGTPNLPVGSPQTFTFLARDPNGYADIYRLYFLVNPDSSIPQNTCHGLYDRQTNSIYLYNNNLTAPIGPLIPGSAGKIENSQCVINGPASALYLTSGNDLGIKLDISLKGSFAAKTQKVYLWATDLQATGTGWVQTGTWTPSSATPVSVAPVFVSATPVAPPAATQTLTVTASDANGFADIYRIYFLINADAAIPQSTCHGLYDRATNAIYLYNDALTQALGPLTPGAAGKIENTQCAINGANSALFIASGNDLALKLDITLKGAYSASPRNIYFWVQDNNGLGTGWKQSGTWPASSSTPNQLPVVVSGTPSLPTTLSQVFTFTGRDGDGYANLSRMYFLVNPNTGIPANTCHGLYDRPTNSIYLYNDALTSLIGPLTPGVAGSIQNSQCAINGASSALFVASGNDLALRLDILRKGSYASGTQRAYVWFRDQQGNDTGWVNTATWVLP